MTNCQKKVACVGLILKIIWNSFAWLIWCDKVLLIM